LNTALAIRKEDDPQIVCLNRACMALELATTAPEIREMYALAAAAEIYAKRQRRSDDVIGAAHRLKIRALAKLGQLLKDSDRNEGIRLAGRDCFGGTKTEPPKNAPPTLADLGIDKKMSSLAQQLASLPAALQDRVANRDVKLVRAILEHRRATAPRPRLPEGKFKVILADPPWAYGGGARSGSDHYDTMSIDEIAAMDIVSLAADNAVLFFWTTAPLLFACEPIINSWGFVYKETMIWDKVRGVCGAYIDVRHEFSSDLHAWILRARSTHAGDRQCPDHPEIKRSQSKA
jgi:hypothetical protein